jgi:site-specific recombinase XerD
LSEGIGLAKINRYLSDLIKFNRLLGKPFEKAKKEDIRNVVSTLNQSPLSEETRKCFKIMLRKLYRMLRGIEDKGVYPDEVKWISIRIGAKDRKLPEELISEDEAKAIVQSCNHIRDKALMACLSESGCRISEIGNMQIKHIVIEPYGARISVNGKTGSRKILIVNSVPYLQEWINSHPDSHNPEAFVWCDAKSDLITYNRIAAILKTAAKKAGIKKRIHPHLLRHSKATQLATFMSDSQLKHYLGWTQGSKMAGIYVHMSGKDTDEAIFRANGIKTTEEKKEPSLKPLACNRCHSINPATHRFCNKCGFVLDNPTAQEIIRQESEQKGAVICLDKLLQDPEVKKILMKKLYLMQIEKP